MNTAALILIGSFVVLLLLNVPIAVCLGMSSIFTFIATGMSFNAIPIQYFGANCKFVLFALLWPASLLQSPALVRRQSRHLA